jgi:hypothetical protein
MVKTRNLRKGSKKKRGGFFGLGSIINTAVVPGSLLTLQQTYRKRKSGGRSGTKRRRRHKKRN